MKELNSNNKIFSTLQSFYKNWLKKYWLKKNQDKKIIRSIKYKKVPSQLWEE